MCLILFAVGVHPDYPLVLAANRDEFHARPAAPADWWADHPDVVGGRDLEAGGTWMGMSRGGRFAAVTNFTEAPPDPMPPRSRGDLVADFLTGDDTPAGYLARVIPDGPEYRGFNLLVGTVDTRGAEFWYGSNRLGSDDPVDAARRLAPGIYGLSNHLLDTAWPRVSRGKTVLADFETAERTPEVEGLLALLGDETELREAELRGIEADVSPGARAPCFIRGETYGTRASTVVLAAADGTVAFTEQRWGPDGVRETRTDEAFALTPREG
jgi:uncharacterized protein with NRDE domain